MDREEKARIEKILSVLRSSRLVGKPLRHFKDVYSTRIRNERLIYKAEGNNIILLFFKSREDVYEYPR